MNTRIAPRFSLRKHAFTLVELMVVLAIIAGLLLMVVPNVRKMRARARSAQCQNNLRQYGVAMNQYLTDWNGFFIYPGAAGGGAQTDYTRGDMGLFKDGVLSAGGISGSSAHSWLNDFVKTYIPAPGVNSMKFLASGEASVRICPEVNRNAFIPNSPEFKGYRYDAATDVETADFENSYNADDELVLLSYFTTYGINSKWLTGARSKINDNVVAFIDWNAEEGWGAAIRNSSIWAYTGRDKYGNLVAQDQSKLALKGATNWWHTEVGFYHPGTGTNMVANYVAMDGSVGNISYHDISITNFDTGL